MSIDSRYISKLDNFTKSLEEIVILLQEDDKKKNAEPVNRLLSNVDNDKLGEVVKNMEAVVKSVSKIESQNDKILAEIKANKKEKESGGLGNIGEVDNKKKIIDAVKIIVLIAAGVLAIGLAFKIIGKVDFLSVIAIGLAILFISGAFVAISAVTEGMQSKDAFKTSALMLIMAGAITMSSWILAMVSTLSMKQVLSVTFTAIAMGASLYVLSLAVEKSKITLANYGKMMALPFILPVIAIGIVLASSILSAIQPLTFMQALTTVFVAGTIGISLFLISQALEKSKLDDDKKEQILWLPLIIPALAAGIVGASYIFSFIKPISFMQAVSAIFVAVTIGVLVYLMKPMIEKLSGITSEQVGNTALLIVALAAGIVGASWAFALVRTMSFKESISLVMTSLAIGLAVLFITPSIYILKGISLPDMWRGTRNIIMASGAIAISSVLLSFGLYSNAPDWQWTVGTGLALVAFAGTIWILNKMGLDGKSIALGGLAIMGISAVIMLSSFILSIGSYTKYPTLGWAMGVGLSLIAFGSTMTILGLILTSTGGTVAIAMAWGAVAILGISAVIVATSYILGAGEYEKYPTLGWIMGVGFTLTAFGGAMVLMGAFLPFIYLGSLSMMLIAGTMVKVSNRISEGNYDVGPNEDWANSVSQLMSTFSSMMIDTALIPNGLLARSAIGLLIVAQNIVDVSKKLSEGTYFGGPTEEWTKSTVGLMIGFSLSSLAMINPLTLLGLFAMENVARKIVEVSNILSSGTYTGGPDENWAKGVGLSIKSFAEGISALDKSSGGIIGKIFGGDNTGMITSIATAMVAANNEFANVKEWKSPPEPWANAVGNSVKSFATAISEMGKADVDPDDIVNMIKGISRGIVAAAIILDEHTWSKTTGFPAPEWSTGVGAALKAFAEPISKLAEFDVTGWEISYSIKKLADGMILAAKILNKYPWADNKNNFPDPNWVNGVGNALNTFVKHLITISEKDIENSDIKNLSRIIDAMVFTALKFKAVSLISGIWSSGGDLSTWSTNVGTAIGDFVKQLEKIESADLGRGEVRILNKVVSSMIDAATSFAFWGMIYDNLWTSGPGKDWKAGESISNFVDYLVTIEKSDLGSGDVRILNKVVDSMISTAVKFAKIEKENATIWESGTKSGIWLTTIGGVIDKFISYLNSTNGKVKDDDVKTLNKIIDSIILTATKFQKVDKSNPGLWKAGPTEGNWGENIEGVINAFSKIVSKDIKVETLNKIVDSIISIAIKFKKAEISSPGLWTAGPTNGKWGENIESTINAFNKIEDGKVKFEALNKIIEAIISTATKFKKAEISIPGLWESGPKNGWGENIENTISAFVKIGIMSGETDNIDRVTDSMITFLKRMSKTLENNSIYEQGGSFETFGTSLKSLTDGLANSEKLANGIDALGDALFKISSKGTTTTDTIKMLSKSISELSRSLKDVDTGPIDTLTKFSNGILVLSLIDEDKFKDVLSVLQSKKNDILSILSVGDGVKSRPSTYGATTLSKPKDETVDKDKTKSDFYTTLLGYVKRLDENVNNMVKPQPTVLSEKDDKKSSVPKANINQTNPVK